MSAPVNKASEAHTPGPHAVFADERSIIVSTADGATRIARMFATNDLANAHLFAAASGLLKMCERILERGYLCKAIPEDRQDHARLVAIIAKAKGEA
jgi:hypothetical protein